jgi:hypothetical protein
MKFMAFVSTTVAVRVAYGGGVRTRPKALPWPLEDPPREGYAVRLGALVETSEGGLVPVNLLATDPEVRSVVTTDLLDPRRYLAGGELVLTGLAWWRAGRPARSRTFVEALAGAGVAALAAGEAALGAVPRDLVAACAEAGLPLLRVPVDHSFATVTERANRQLGGRDDLVAVLARHRALVAAVAARENAGSGLARVLDLVASDLGAAVWVLSPGGRLISASGAPPDDEARRRLARQYLAVPRLPHRVGDVTIVADGLSKVDGWFLVHSFAGHLSVVDELRSLIQLEYDLAHRRSEAHLALAAALDGTVASDVDAALRRCGLDPRAPAVVLAATGPLAAPVLAEALASQDAVWAPAATDVVAVVPADDTAALLAHVRATVDFLARGLGPQPLRIGLSDPVSGGAGLLGAVAEARAAAAIADPRPHTVTGPDRLSSHALLLAAVPAELRQAYRGRVLGPLLEHDRVHHTELVATLAAYLECSGSWSRCAAAMHLHVNTVRYRIERIEALTGRDLRRLADQTDLLLALQLEPR